MITCMNTYLLSPNHCYNWAPCLGVRLSCLTRSDVSQVTVICKHLASFTFDIQLLWNCGLAKPRGVNRETGSDPCLVLQLVSTCLSPVRTEISAHLKEGRLPSMCFLCEEKWQIQVINRNSRCQSCTATVCVGHPLLRASLPGWFWPGARVQGADPGGGGGPGRAVRQPGDVQPERQRAGAGRDRQHPEHAQT